MLNAIHKPVIAIFFLYQVVLKFVFHGIECVILFRLLLILMILLGELLLLPFLPVPIGDFFRVEIEQLLLAQRVGIPAEFSAAL